MPQKKTATGYEGQQKIKSHVHIPFAKGLNQKTDQRQAAAGTLERIENLRFAKHGRLDAIPAFQDLEQQPAVSVDSIDSPRLNELFCFSRAGTYRRSPIGFQRIGQESFFSTTSSLIQREETEIQRARVFKSENSTFSVYEVNDKLKYSLVRDADNYELISGQINGNDPIPVVKDGIIGFWYFNNLGNLSFFDTASAAIILNKHANDGRGGAGINSSEIDYSYTVLDGTLYLLFFRGNSLRAYECEPGNINPTFHLSTLTDLSANKKIFVRQNSESVAYISMVSGSNFRNFSFDMDGKTFTSVAASRNLNIGNLEKALYFPEKGVTLVEKDAVISVDANGSRKILFEKTSLSDSFYFKDELFILISNTFSAIILNSDFQIVCSLNGNNLNAERVSRNLSVFADGNYIYNIMPRVTSVEGRGLLGYSATLFKSFDSGLLHRQAKTIGEITLISGSPIGYWDGRNIVEYGFTEKPSIEITTDTNSADPFSYAYAVCYKWIDALGLEHFSGVNYGQVVLAEKIDTDNQVEMTISTPLTSSKKLVLVEIYRTTSNGVNFHKVASLPADTKTYTDNADDEKITDKELLYSQGLTGENFKPSGANIIEAFTDRVLLSGLERDERTVLLSRPFSFALARTLEFDGLDSLVFQDKIISINRIDNNAAIFTEKKIYVLNISGLGRGSVPQEVQTPGDVVPESSYSIIRLQNGLLFKSVDGFYLLNRSFTVQYVGASVENFNNQRCRRSAISNSQKEVYFLMDDKILIYRTDSDAWSTLDADGIKDIALVEDKLAALTNEGVIRKEGEFLETDKTYVIETSWISMSYLQGYSRMRRVEFMMDIAEAKSAKVSFGYNHVEDRLSEPISLKPTANRTHYRISPSRQKCTAIKIRLEIVSTKYVNISGVAIEYVAIPSAGLYKEPT